MSDKAGRLGIYLSIFMVALLVALAPFGCVPRRGPTPAASTGSGGEPVARAVDETTMMFESIRNLNNPAAIEKDPFGRITGNSYANKAIFYLKQWLARQDFESVEGGWKLDPLFSQLPRSLREHPLFQRLDQLDYYQPDVFYLQQCLWENDIAQRVTREPRSPALDAWLKELEDGGQVEAARQLGQAERLFDWTVRNIQLKPLLPPPKGPELKVDEGQKLDARSPAERGIAGPGYQQLPYQTLLYAEGDAWERGRIFLHLCRQAGLAAVMLGTSKPNELGGPQAWVAAVLIRGQGAGVGTAKDELYLFDPQLGLPIPGPDRKGIATLTQFVGDATLLAALQPAEGEPYRITAEDLKNVGALFDMQPETLSRRMDLLEGPMNEARKQSRTEQKSEEDANASEALPIVLVARPSDIEPALRKLKHISTVGLWRVPFEALQYAQALPEIAAKDPIVMQRLMEREGMLNGEKMIYLGTTQTVDRSQAEGQQIRQRTPRNVTLIQGRDYTLRGRFEDLDTRPGARSVYLSFRPSEQDIALHEFNINFMNANYGNDQPYRERWKDKPEVRAADMAHIARMMRLSKSHATYWLGLTYFETGEYENAIQWLEPLARGTSEPGPWQAGARYLTARSYEALGKTDQAKELYLADDSPQAAGNKLRAAWLTLMISGNSNSNE
jgi:hypothetical protein